MRKLLVLASFVAGCSQQPITSTNPDGNTGVPQDFAMPVLPDLANTGTMGLSIGPIDLMPTQERTVCSRFKLDNAAAIDVTQISAVLAPGSHHLIFYRSMDTVEQKAIYDCQPLDIATGDIPIYIAETAMNNTLPLPTGVAYHFEPGEMVKIEAHYINSTTKEIMGMGQVSLLVGAPMTYQKADIMFCGSVSQLVKKQDGTGGVPPGLVDLNPNFYAPPAGLKFFGLTTHEHKRGSLMEIANATSAADTGTNLIMGKPYDNPPFNIYTDSNLLTFQPGEGFRWVCHYNNTTQNTYYFGQSAESNEMCFFWAYYYPSVGRFISLECAQ